jgi:hypothetical protein
MNLYKGKEFPNFGSDEKGKPKGNTVASKVISARRQTAKNPVEIPRQNTFN